MIGEIVTGAEEWDLRLYGLAEYFATFSKDPRRKVGSVVVSADRRQFSPGYNGFPRGTPDLKQHLMDDETRQRLMVHGEVNSITSAPFDVAGCTLYCTKFPCHVCAGTIANARISRIVCPAPDFTHRTWGSSYALASEILSNAGVELATFRTPVEAGRTGEGPCGF